MKVKKLLFVYNPHAGKELMKRKLSAVIEQFCCDGYLVTVYATRGAGDATAIVAEQGLQFDRIVCSGGDGTMHETMEGLMQLPPEKRCPCGYIPAGTVNDFANSMKIPRKVELAAEIASRGNPIGYDIGEMNGKYFNYIAAFGAFTSVSYETPQTTKNVLGKGAYFLDALTKLPAIKPKHAIITVDNTTVIEDDFVFGMVTNSISVGGFPLFRKTKVSLNDGLFEGVFIRNPKNPVELQAVVAAFMSAKSNEQIITIRGKSFEIEGSEMLSYTLDGESGGEYKTVMIENHHRAVTYINKSRK